MPAQLIDGKAIAQEVRAEIRERVEAFFSKTGVRPCLAAVLVGDHPASAVYVRNKARACGEAGILSRRIDLPGSLSQEDLLATVAQLNGDPAVHGILVQLPLPDQIDESRIIEAVSPDKDVDGFHPVNAGRLLAGAPSFVPCTPLGILRMLDRESVDLAGKRAVVVGRSNIVGKPIALLLLSRHATVTICHSRTRDLPGVVRTAEVVVAAVGKPEMIRGSWLSPGSVVIDVGINRMPDGRLAGDVAFEEALPVASKITPVPGGVGPMTIAMLLHNTLEAAVRRTAAVGR